MLHKMDSLFSLQQPAFFSEQVNYENRRFINLDNTGKSRAYRVLLQPERWPRSFGGVRGKKLPQVVRKPMGRMIPRRKIKRSYIGKRSIMGNCLSCYTVVKRGSEGIHVACGNCRTYYLFLGGISSTTVSVLLRLRSQSSERRIDENPCQFKAFAKPESPDSNQS